VSRQVGGRQDASDNSLDTIGYHTPGLRQFVYDKWRRRDWLATHGLRQSESSVQSISDDRCF